MASLFAVTPWRDAEELLRLRADMYERNDHDDVGEDRRERAVDKIHAWRLRNIELPLLLESTADLVGVLLREERGGLPHQPLRLLYGAAVSRFITGFADTSTELRRSKPSFISPSSTETLDLPPQLLETRHAIVHRHLPSLPDLKRAAQLSLHWLWECYWSHLDRAFSHSAGSSLSYETHDEVKESLQALLKSYVRQRKNEVKQHRAKSAPEASKAVQSAISSYLALSGSPSANQKTLIELLVDEKAILPTDKRFGTTMSGAFLLWSTLLLALSSTLPAFLAALADRIARMLNSPVRHAALEVDPTREGMYEWLVHVSTSAEWESARQRDSRGMWTERILERCFTAPTHWNLRVAETVLKGGQVSGKAAWEQILKAAKEEGMEIDEAGTTEDMDMDRVEDVGFTEASRVEETVREKRKGPWKPIGMWRRTPIGVLPKGWEDDE